MSTATPKGWPGAGTLAKTVVSPIAGWLGVTLAMAGAIGPIPITPSTTAGSHHVFTFIVCPPVSGGADLATPRQDLGRRRLGNLWDQPALL
ncbi:MAG: hypothetical protein E6I37_16635 [Chloroflexi bacterium]|nr:MAG: hypothetical protein E6I37_16635 [Chloroflexota bacterium]